MVAIYCDESGNSGEKLTDHEQPYFVLASNDLSKAEAEALLEHVRSHQGDEAKFKVLKKSQAGIKRLTNLFTDPRLNETRVVVDIYHKRFMVVTKMVDLIAETLINDIGEDLYKQGANIAMSNMLYYCMPVFCGIENTDRFLESFVNLMRFRSDDCIKEFFEAGKSMMESSVDNEFKDDLQLFTDSSLFHRWFPYIGNASLEPAIPALFEHINEWGRRKLARFQVIHDSSKPVLASHETFEQMMALHDEKSELIGYDRRKYLFPLRAISLEQGDSISHPQIQIADICSGAINHYLKCREMNKMDSLAVMIHDTGCLKWIINGLYPTPDVTPEDLGTASEDGINPVDHMVDYLYEK
ncbi:hypothetical protein C3Y98_04300 [Methylotenera oryzisoli]|uniref:DUF3800 domain-containing protein n=1 Tax=Methylotenera oryzisoli TaxID=2080758 RepID=A0A4Y9VT45_9PROT|nr:DUF3800 domain-containing protein [Methylotenera oryzisoli]TFW72332.1 hypothetical protein C3Y98_04300 [Methylotenera oryzisoli]